MTVTGSVDKMKSLARVLDFASKNVPLETVQDSKDWISCLEWAVIVDQQIKDSQFEQSINPLPFK